MLKEISLDGVQYVLKSELPQVPSGNRCVVVVDRGWVFAGDVERKDGRIKISNALWVFRWESIGFDGMVRDPKSSKVTIKPLGHCVDMPADAEVFCVPVSDTWGK